MPRSCILCGKHQTKSFSVFSFPTSSSQRAAWVEIVLDSKTYLENERKFRHKDILKYGICELHFLRSEINKGKKRRLVREAVPTLNIFKSPKSCYVFKPLTLQSIVADSVVSNKISKSVERVNPAYQLSQTLDLFEEISSKGSHDLTDCTVKFEINDGGYQSPKVHKSLVDNIFGGKDALICLCCGSQQPLSSFYSILSRRSVENRPLLSEVSNLFQIPGEKLVEFSTFLCRKCLKIMEDMFELRRHFDVLLSHLKNKFLITNKSLEICSKTDSYLEVNGENKSEIATTHDSSTVTTSARKSNRSCLQNKRFPCSECCAKFDNLSALFQHQLSHDSEVGSENEVKISKMKQSCITCCASFDSQLELKIHMKSHNHNYDCPHCGRLITSEARLKHHMFKFHGIGEEKTKMFRCKLCDRKFSSRAASRYHEWSSHKVGDPFTCEICQKVFHYKMLYKSHKLFSHGKKNVICEVCGKMFFTVSVLNVHINSVHRNALSWHCKICNEKFSTTTAYRHHMTMKHKPVVHKCTHCNSQFRKKYSLTQHLWTHGVFRCQRCNANHSDSLSFISHMAQAHKIDVSHKFNNKVSSVPVNEKDSINVKNSLEGETKKKDSSPIVINDILIASSDLENSSLQSFAIRPEGKEADQKSSFELSAIDPIHFNNDDALVNESVELEDDSLINVHMLEDIHVPQHTTLNPLKSGISSEKAETITISNPLQSISSSSSQMNESVSTNLKLNTDESESSDTTLNKIAVIDGLTPSSHSVSPKHNDDTVSIVEPLTDSHLETADLAELPAILQPIFPNPLTQSTDSSEPVAHSLSVEEDPPVTMEIDITVPSEDEESKMTPLPTSITDQDKMDEQDLHTLSLDIDGKGEVHYVVYFNSPIEKG